MQGFLQLHRSQKCEVAQPPKKNIYREIRTNTSPLPNNLSYHCDCFFTQDIEIIRRELPHFSNSRTTSLLLSIYSVIYFLSSYKFIWAKTDNSFRETRSQMLLNFPLILNFTSSCSMTDLAWLLSKTYSSVCMLDPISSDLFKDSILHLVSFFCIISFCFSFGSFFQNINVTTIFENSFL